MSVIKNSVYIALHGDSLTKIGPDYVQEPLPTTQTSFSIQATPCEAFIPSQPLFRSESNVEYVVDRYNELLASYPALTVYCDTRRVHSDVGLNAHAGITLGSPVMRILIDGRPA